MKLPQRITLDGVEIWPSPLTPPLAVPGCPGWTRASTPRDARTVADVSVVEWRGPFGVVLVDVMSRRTDRLVVPLVDGFATPVRPLAGLGFESEHPDAAGAWADARADVDPAFDQVVAKLNARVPIDRYLVHEGGSPREAGEEAFLRTAMRTGRLSPAMREHLGAWTSAQLARPYQDPDADGLPSGLTSVAHEVADAAGANAFLGVPYWAGHCPCHFTVDKLATAYTLTGSPRALDQLVRLVTHAFLTEDYLALHADKYGNVAVHGFYFDTPRMIGWPLKAVAVALRAIRRAMKVDPLGSVPLVAIAKGLKAFAGVHVAHVLDHWPVGTWSAFETSDPRGGHSAQPHDVVFMQAVLAMGARECAKLDVAGAAMLHGRAVEWIDRYGWDRSAAGRVDVYYDALKAGGGTSPGDVSDGVRLWTVQAMTGTGTELERRLIEDARLTDFWGVPDVDTRNLLFPGLEWIPDDFRELRVAVAASG